MAYSISGNSGVDFNQVYLATDLPPHKLGTQQWGDDGKLYVFAQANASIPASTAVCTVNATTFLATASGGSYTSPATALVSGNRAWFGKASV
jgi:hypothetical protein